MSQMGAKVNDMAINTYWVIFEESLDGLGVFAGIFYFFWSHADLVTEFWTGVFE